LSPLRDTRVRAGRSRQRTRADRQSWQVQEAGRCWSKTGHTRCWSKIGHQQGESSAFSSAQGGCPCTQQIQAKDSITLSRQPTSGMYSLTRVSTSGMRTPSAVMSSMNSRCGQGQRLAVVVRGVRQAAAGRVYGWCMRPVRQPGRGDARGKGVRLATHSPAHELPERVRGLLPVLHRHPPPHLVLGRVLPEDVVVRHLCAMFPVQRLCHVVTSDLEDGRSVR